MPRDNILDEAEQKEKENSTSNGSESETDETADDQEAGGEERERLTQRMPADLLEDVDEVEEKFKLGNRNSTINFLVSHAVDDLLNK